MSAAAGGGPDLVVFTVRFPYAGSEPWLAGELAAIAPRCRRVVVVPSHAGEGPPAALPANVEVAAAGRRGRRPRRRKLRALRSREALRVLARTLRRPSNWLPYLRGARSYLDLLAGELLKARELEAWIGRERLGEAIFYDYWLENSTLALALLRRRGVVRCAVARAHRYDVFDFAWGRLGRVPFREFKAAWLDAVFAVSEDGAAYLRERLGRDAGKVRVARLGVPLPPAYPAPRPEPPLVVSCSSLNRRKRVHAIPAVLAACERPLRWVHIGDGPERARVEAAAAELPASVEWELLGRIDNRAVSEFYAGRPASAFLSLSASEGVPVSIMEALSYGVPAVALAVGGVGEIVTPEAGIALPADAPPAAVAAALARALEPDRFDPDAVRAAFAARFEAPAVYEAFFEELLSLCSASAARGHGSSRPSSSASRATSGSK